MKLIYVAGPFRSKSYWDIEQNTRIAESVGRDIIDLGAYPVIPHSSSRYYRGLKEDKFFLDGTLELMRRCDAVYMIPNWKKSQGSVGEYHEARKLEMPIFEYYTEITKFLEENK